MRTTPHYLRFARSLALVGAFGLAACGDDDKGGTTDTAPDTAGDTVADTTPDTAGDTAEDTVADTAGDTAEDTVADTTPDTIEDTAVDCDACECGAAASQACIDNCCIAVGPLYPPDLPA